MSCSYHKEIKDSLNASQTAYQIQKQSFSFSATSFHPPLPSQGKFNVLTGATGLSTHTDVPQRWAAPLPELFNNTPTTNYTQWPHCAHTETSFSSFCYILVWPCEFPTKSHKFTCFGRSLKFATSMSWAYRARLCSNASHSRTPHLHSIDLCQNSLSYEKTQWLKQTSSSGTQSSCTAPLPFMHPQNEFLRAVSLASFAALNPMPRKPWTFLFPGSLRESLTDPGGISGSTREELLGACPAPSFYLV